MKDRWIENYGNFQLTKVSSPIPYMNWAFTGEISVIGKQPDDRKHFTAWWSEVLNKLGTNVTADDLVQSTEIDQDLFAEMCKPSDDVYYQSIKVGFYCTYESSFICTTYIVSAIQFESYSISHILFESD